MYATVKALDVMEPLSRQRCLAVDDTYQEMYGLIRHTVRGFVQEFGGDFDDLLAEANSCFMAAYNDYPGNPKFSTWLRNYIRWELLDGLRPKARRNKRTERIGEREFPDNHSTFTVQTFLRELGGDAQLVAKLVLDAPAEISTVAEAKGGQPRNYRSTVRAYLRGLRWGADRINESFEEIAKVLIET